MQLHLDEVGEYIKLKGYNEYIANKVGMIQLYENKLTLTDTDTALENLFINTGINKDTPLIEAIDIDVTKESLLKKKVEVNQKGIPTDNTGIPFSKVGRPLMNSEVYQNDKEVYLDNREVYQTGNVNIISTKVDDLLENKIKNRAKELGVSVSALIRTDLMKIYGE